MSDLSPPGIILPGYNAIVRIRGYVETLAAIGGVADLRLIEIVAGHSLDADRHQHLGDCIAQAQQLLDAGLDGTEADVLGQALMSGSARDRLFAVQAKFRNETLRTRDRRLVNCWLATPRPGMRLGRGEHLCRPRGVGADDAWLTRREKCLCAVGRPGALVHIVARVRGVRHRTNRAEGEPNERPADQLAESPR